jgi:hypothetical protein
MSSPPAVGGALTGSGFSGCLEKVDFPDAFISYS